MGLRLLTGIAMLLFFKCLGVMTSLTGSYFLMGLGSMDFSGVPTQEDCIPLSCDDANLPLVWVASSTLSASW